MKLEPVFLAPKPTSRRSFLAVGIAFTGGFLTGGACGFAVGVGASGGGTASEPDLAPTGNAELDELRRLAVSAPIEELAAQSLNFLNVREAKYQADTVLVTGVLRLAEHAMQTPELRGRKAYVRALINALKIGAAAGATQQPQMTQALEALLR